MWVGNRNSELAYKSTESCGMTAKFLRKTSSPIEPQLTPSTVMDPCLSSTILIQRRQAAESILSHENHLNNACNNELLPVTWHSVR